LFYNSSTASGSPDVEWDFTDVLVSGHVALAGGSAPEEQDSFVFGSVEQPPPTVAEPPEVGTFWIILGVVAFLRMKSCPVPA
jgi:hypothetical protein